MYAYCALYFRTDCIIHGTIFRFALTPNRRLLFVGVVLCSYILFEGRENEEQLQDTVSRTYTEIHSDEALRIDTLTFLSAHHYVLCTTLASFRIGLNSLALLLIMIFRVTFWNYDLNSSSVSRSMRYWQRKGTRNLITLLKIAVATLVSVLYGNELQEFWVSFIRNYVRGLEF